jgi:hypothetical protein
MATAPDGHGGAAPGRSLEAGAGGRRRRSRRAIRWGGLWGRIRAGPRGPRRPPDCLPVAAAPGSQRGRRTGRLARRGRRARGRRPGSTGAARPAPGRTRLSVRPPVRRGRAHRPQAPGAGVPLPLASLRVGHVVRLPPSSARRRRRPQHTPAGPAVKGRRGRVATAPPPGRGWAVRRARGRPSWWWCGSCPVPVGTGARAGRGDGGGAEKTGAKETRGA